MSTIRSVYQDLVTMEFYSTARTEIMPFSGKWKELDVTALEHKLSSGQLSHVSFYTWNVGLNNNMKTMGTVQDSINAMTG